jgi:hypothetical protein
MSRRRFNEQERRLAVELNAKFRGSASIKIEVLHFPENGKTDNEKTTERLKKLFRKQKGCHDWEIFDRVPVVIEQRQIDEALARAGISSAQLLEARDGHIELDFPADVHLRCLRGRHRVLAAPGTLPLNGRRWTVDLFLSDLDNDLKTALVEEYTCEKRPDDGEIYCKIREYQGYGGGGNPYFETRWWALLCGIADRKPDNMKQILRNEDFRHGFDIQLDIPGLRGGMMLGPTHKMFAMRCHEVKDRLYYIRNTNCGRKTFIILMI